MKKKHIAIFAEKLYGGGVEKILQIICKNLDFGKYDLTLYSSNTEDIPSGCYPENINHAHYFSTVSQTDNPINKIIKLACNKIKLFCYYNFSPSFYYKLFIRYKYDVGIAFIEGYATRFLSGAPRDMKKIAWIHTDIEKNHWTKVAFRNSEEEIQCYTHFDKAVCVSKVVESQAKKCLNLSSTVVLHNPIESDIILQKSNLYEVPQKRHSVRLVSLGSLMPVKGYDRLIEVAKRLSNDEIDFELLILGEGKERENLTNLIRQHNLEDKVQLIGYLDNPYPYLRTADIYICSSFAEGFNTAITESLILGRAIVTTEVSGVREQLGDNAEYGIITDNSTDGIYLGIKQMLEPGMISYYQNQARIRSSLFNLEQQMSQIYNLIES